MGFSATAGFLAGSAAWTARIEREWLGLRVGMGLSPIGNEEEADGFGISDLVGMREEEAEETDILFC